MSRIAILFLLSIFSFFYSPQAGTAAVFIRKSIPGTDTIKKEVPMTRRELMRKERFMSPFKRLQLEREYFATRRNNPRADAKNTDGVISLVLSMTSLAALVAILIAIPTLAVGTGFILGGVFAAVSVVAIIFGAIGLRHDKNQGYAVAGMAIGITELSVAFIIGVFILLSGF
jgi:hypothetical protein